MNYNKVTIVGRTTKKPELKTTPNGIKVVTFSLATSEKYKEEEKTEFHNIVAFNKTAEIIAQYVEKGQLLLIEGKLSTSSWEDKQGNKRYKTDIIAEKMQMGPRAMTK
jgi:single-strand DNA-binding protein